MSAAAMFFLGRFTGWVIYPEIMLGLVSGAPRDELHWPFNVVQTTDPILPLHDGHGRLRLWRSAAQQLVEPEQRRADGLDRWRVATLAARLLDARRGNRSRGYRFSAFAPNGDSDGYFIFDCGPVADRAPEPLSDDAEPEAATAVMTACFYVGYVRRCR